MNKMKKNIKGFISFQGICIILKAVLGRDVNLLIRFTWPYTHNLPINQGIVTKPPFRPRDDIGREMILGLIWKVTYTCNDLFITYFHPSFFLINILISVNLNKINKIFCYAYQYS